ncbi:hypothetical protein D3C81_256710 [compost metagenome]
MHCTGQNHFLRIRQVPSPVRVNPRPNILVLFSPDNRGHAALIAGGALRAIEVGYSGYALLRIIGYAHGRRSLGIRHAKQMMAVIISKSGLGAVHILDRSHVSRRIVMKSHAAVCGISDRCQLARAVIAQAQGSARRLDSLQLGSLVSKRDLVPVQIRNGLQIARRVELIFISLRVRQGIGFG